MSVVKWCAAWGLAGVIMAGGVGAGVSGKAWAQSPPPSEQCVRPATPACIDDLTTYVSADKMVACQNQVQEFMTAMANYQTCRGKLQDVQAGEDMVQSLRRFNCRLQGGGDCP